MRARERDEPVPAAAIPGRDEGPLVPLVVDLDGTLLRTDLLLEGVVAILRRNVLMLFWMLAWLPRGRAYFKRRVAERAALDFATLPANEELLAYIELQKTLGREIVLATQAILTAWQDDPCLDEHGLTLALRVGGGVQVNGRRLTTSAGGQDDGASANGALITVGGIGDSTANPSDPDALPTSARDDDERYDLLPFLQDNVPYDPARDFAPVSAADRSPMLLVVHPALPVNSVQALITLARARPGELNYATAGLASAGHIGHGAQLRGTSHATSGNPGIDRPAGPGTQRRQPVGAGERNSVPHGDGLVADRRQPAARSADGRIPHASHPPEPHEEPAAHLHGGGDQCVAGRR